MKHLLLILIMAFGTSSFIVSCKKSEDVNVGKIEEIGNTQTSEEKGLSKAMKQASGIMRRLSRAVENNDWVEIDMWTQELKEGIGFECVELYMIENNDISNEFVALSNNFNNAINKLILSGKQHDVSVSGVEFSRLKNSCDACHEKYKERS